MKIWFTVSEGAEYAGVSRDTIGHASIVTTERYDNQRLEALQAAVAARSRQGIRRRHRRDGELVPPKQCDSGREGRSFKNLSSSDRTESRRRLWRHEGNLQK